MQGFKLCIKNGRCATTRGITNSMLTSLSLRPEPKQIVKALALHLMDRSCAVLNAALPPIVLKTSAIQKMRDSVAALLPASCRNIKSLKAKNFFEQLDCTTF